MIPELVQLLEIDILPLDVPGLDHLQFHGNQLKFLVLAFVVVIDNSIGIELHHVQDTMTFITKEETLDLPTTLLSEKVDIVLFLDPILE